MGENADSFPGDKSPTPRPEEDAAAPTLNSPRRSPLCCYDRGEINDDGPVPAMEWPADGAAPEMLANPISRLLFCWVQPLFSRASYLRRHGKALEQNDLLPLPDMDFGDPISKKFEVGWKSFAEKAATKKLAVAEEAGKQKKDGHAELSATKGTQINEKETADIDGHLYSALLSVMGRRFVLSGLVKLLYTALRFTFPILLNALLRFIEQRQKQDSEENSKEDAVSSNRGYWIAAILLVTMSIKAVTENAYFNMVYRCAYQAKVAVSTSVYDKSLRLAGANRGGTSLGELVNLMQVDATKIEMFIPQFHVLWDGVIQIIGFMTILYTLIGWPCFVGLIVMIVAGPLQVIIMKRLFGLHHQMVKHTDARVKTTNEALQGIQCVKMYAWEQSLENKVFQSRFKELGLLRTVAYLRGFSRAYMSALPEIVAVVSFVVYAATGGAITSSVLFSALLAFGQLRSPLLFYPMALAQLAQAKVSARRVAKFLELKEKKNGGGRYERVGSATTAAGSKGEEEVGREGEIVVEDASVYWTDPDTPVATGRTDEKLDDLKETNRMKENSFSTNDNDKPTEVHPSATLAGISFQIDSGRLCAVIGRVGCGKSTICSAVLNETILGQGRISVRGSVAYAAQSAWILNATIRDNILFGLPMDEARYDAVIKACQLTHDLSILNKGDLTEIGERGINLSGGQKQRVSIARAAYSNADIIILDDPLSALDPAVGQSLFEDCILGLMKGKTRLLVTNQLQCLKHCDTVITLGDGRIIEQGTYQDLMNEKDGEVRRLLNELKGSSGSDTHADGEATSNGVVEACLEGNEVVPEGNTEAKDVKEEELTTKEDRAIGSVKFPVYMKYFASGGSLLHITFIAFAYILCAGVELLTNLWVAAWTADSNYERQSASFYMGFYALTAVGVGVITFLRSFLFARFGVNASLNLHNKLLSSVLRAPQSFFDTTPTGRIVSRFSKDMHSIDEEVSETFDTFLWCVLYVLSSLATIAVATPWFGIAVLPLMIIYIKILNYFRDVSRETKRLESISRSPVYAHFSETIGGLATIRAYEQSTRFIVDFLGKVDANTKAYYCNKTAERWLSVRLELLGAIIAGLAAFFAINVVVSRGASSLPINDNFASIAGLSLTYAFSITGLLNWSVRSFAQLEAGMNSVERVLFYTEDIPQEGARTADELEKNTRRGADPSVEPSAIAVTASSGKVIHLAPEWPVNGAISLNNLTMRYRPGTPIVLKGLSVSILGGERVGVVGRTGSGKSSLLLSLLRIVEPELAVDRKDYTPPIMIDGVDVLRIGLTDLRSKIGIIPQNPVLFSGTFRSNLDPFDEYSDAQLWAALDGSNMKRTVEQTPDGLDGEVAEYGENLSQGQRQLLCLGRALLKRCRILLLDEATSSVDFETDREIQLTLRNSFAGATVLTIAHRVNTIMDSDKILVIKDGAAEEFAPPEDLLSNDNSLFSEIVRHAETKKHQ